MRRLKTSAETIPFLYVAQPSAAPSDSKKIGIGSHRSSPVATALTIDYCLLPEPINGCLWGHSLCVSYSRYLGTYIIPYHLAGGVYVAPASHGRPRHATTTRWFQYLQLLCSGKLESAPGMFCPVHSLNTMSRYCLSHENSTQSPTRPYIDAAHCFSPHYSLSSSLAALKSFTLPIHFDGSACQVVKEPRSASKS